ncbi:MAG: hypothetical protein HC857_03425 [Synechococcales cyanobacterium RU_4_20]|nr:hypothetical protein [Synechococcales cyanobacterium RU_4_20]
MGYAAAISSHHPKGAHEGNMVALGKAGLNLKNSDATMGRFEFSKPLGGSRLAILRSIAPGFLTGTTYQQIGRCAIRTSTGNSGGCAGERRGGDEGDRTFPINLGLNCLPVTVP